MRERLDCAMLSTPSTEQWINKWVGAHAGGRLYVHTLTGCAGASDQDSCQHLGQSAMVLRRFDVCLIPVSAQNLAWVRTSLSSAQGLLKTPVLGLVRQLTAGALNDLYGLGLADFVRDPLCAEELRIRVERLLHEQRYRAADSPAFTQVPPLREMSTPYGRKAPLTAAALENELCSTILERTGLELEAFAVASASRCATSKESFRVAKGKVIERFERAYIAAALVRHSGNIAMAARAAQKHRRAFWALMRKYQIDAAPYRTESPPNLSPDG